MKYSGGKKIQRVYLIFLGLFSHQDMGGQVWGHVGIKVLTQLKIDEQNPGDNLVRWSGNQEVNQKMVSENTLSQGHWPSRQRARLIVSQIRYPGD